MNIPHASKYETSGHSSRSANDGRGPSSAPQGESETWTLPKWGVAIGVALLALWGISR